MPWPKRKPKEGAKKGDMETFEGMLRRLAEKELILETPDQGVLRFRLLAKTQFRNKKGYRARIRNHGHSCFLCEIVIRSQFHTTYEPEA
jgi:hypothetical protein